MPMKSNFESEANASNLHNIPSVKVLGMNVYFIHIRIYNNICIYAHINACMYVYGMHERMYVYETLVVFMYFWCLL